MAYQWTILPLSNAPVPPSLSEHHAQPLQVQPTHPSSSDEAPADPSPYGIEEEEEEDVVYTEHNPRPEGRNLYLVSRGYLPNTHILLTIFQRELREFLIAEKVWLPALKKK